MWGGGSRGQEHAAEPSEGRRARAVRSVWQVALPAPRASKVSIYLGRGGKASGQHALSGVRITCSGPDTLGRNRPTEGVKLECQEMSQAPEETDTCSKSGSSCSAVLQQALAHKRPKPACSPCSGPSSEPAEPVWPSEGKHDVATRPSRAAVRRPCQGTRTGEAEDAQRFAYGHGIPPRSLLSGRVMAYLRGPCSLAHTERL